MFRTTVTYKFTEGGIEHSQATENRDMDHHNAAVHGMMQGLVFGGPVIILSIDSKEIPDED